MGAPLGVTGTSAPLGAFTGGLIAIKIKFEAFCGALWAEKKTVARKGAGMEEEREQLEVDVAVVGGGPAGLSAALRLGQLAAEAGVEPNIVLFEKGLAVGSHAISGALLDPQALKELVP